MIDGDGPALDQELAAMRAERDAAVRALDRQGRRDRRADRVRRGVVGSLIAVFAVLLPVTVASAVTHNVVLNTNGWVRTMGPIAHEPAVIDAVSRESTDELYAALNPQSLIAGALPAQAAFLAGPIANAARGYVQDAVTRVLQSPQFQTLWLQANRFAHAQLLAVVRGGSTTVQTTDGQVVLNLVPLLNAALQSLSGFVSGVVGRPVTLPAISASDVPSAACAKISAALNRPLPATCGQIALFPAAKLTQVRRGVKAFDRIVILLLILTPLVALMALGLSHRRRRTLPALAAAAILGTVVARRTILWFQHDLSNLGQPVNRAARVVILHHVLHGYFTATYWTLVILLLVLAGALLTGPYAWARSLRDHLATAAVAVAHLAATAAGRTTNPGTTAWINRHHDILRLAGYLAAALAVLVVPFTLPALLIIAALLALYQWALHHLSPTTGDGPGVPGGEPVTAPADTPRPEPG